MYVYTCLYANVCMCIHTCIHTRIKEWCAAMDGDGNGILDARELKTTQGRCIMSPNTPPPYMSERKCKPTGAIDPVDEVGGLSGAGGMEKENRGGGRGQEPLPAPATVGMQPGFLGQFYFLVHFLKSQVYRDCT